MGAERLIAAQRDQEKIAVEIKSFLAPSNLSEFHTALGQFLNYRIVLREKQPERELYLAVNLETYIKVKREAGTPKYDLSRVFALLTSARELYNIWQILKGIGQVI
ncbi:fatty-acid oxidation protein subunit alpha [Nostoc cycadae WK-1]|uniref:Fatty-acid oxidation protein subunit alpha n=1 Tax=Nostoc cycadae WK-1 TaxID=1861711 RepID=A0A2H6LH77_9NOSO|nr:fatty-acid oxidation protein subunit alpha [Nostoc cycadae WK-1]